MVDLCVLERKRWWRAGDALNSEEGHPSVVAEGSPVRTLAISAFEKSVVLRDQEKGKYALPIKFFLDVFCPPLEYCSPVLLDSPTRPRLLANAMDCGLSVHWIDQERV